MKRVFTLLLITFICFSANSVYALSINNETNYTRYAQNRAKYYPQNTFANRYRRQQRQNYIFSPQQARYYGYRTPNQMGSYSYNNTYYNRFNRARY